MSFHLSRQHSAQIAHESLLKARDVLGEASPMLKNIERCFDGKDFIRHAALILLMAQDAETATHIVMQEQDVIEPVARYRIREAVSTGPAQWWDMEELWYQKGLVRGSSEYHFTSEGMDSASVFNKARQRINQDKTFKPVLAAAIDAACCHKKGVSPESLQYIAVQLIADPRIKEFLLETLSRDAGPDKHDTYLRISCGMVTRFATVLDIHLPEDLLVKPAIKHKTKARCAEPKTSPRLVVPEPAYIQLVEALRTQKKISARDARITTWFVRNRGDQADLLTAASAEFRAPKQKLYQSYVRGNAAVRRELEKQQEPVSPARS